MDLKEQQEQLDKFRSLVKKIKTCILVTHSSEHALKGRPMATAGLDDDNTIWFFTNEFSEKSAEIADDSQVILTYANASDNDYLTVTGSAIINTDKAMMAKLFTPALKAWFPEGLDDPRLALLQVTPNEVEYWDNSSSKIVILFQMLKSIVTGNQFNEGEHAAITM